MLFSNPAKSIMAEAISYEKREIAACCRRRLQPRWPLSRCDKSMIKKEWRRARDIPPSVYLFQRLRNRIRMRFHTYGGIRFASPTVRPLSQPAESIMAEAISYEDPIEGADPDGVTLGGRYPAIRHSLQRPRNLMRKGFRACGWMRSCYSRLTSLVYFRGAMILLR